MRNQPKDFSEEKPTPAFAGLIIGILMCVPFWVVLYLALRAWWLQ